MNAGISGARSAPLILALVAFAGGAPLGAQPVDPALRDKAIRALKTAATYYREKVASHGGYVYYTSEDLSRRWGEGEADHDTIFVQPPGTPTVGMAFLAAFEATGDRAYLDAAREAAEALVRGQLDSGGWTQTIRFARSRAAGKYRKGGGGSRNVSSLDDGQTQAALLLLMRADRALEFRHAEIHEAARYGLDALLAAQFPNGGFPQVWSGPVAPRPIVRARFPDYDWKTEGKIKNYWDHYTLNDGLAGTVADVLIEAHRIYGDDRFRAALARLGDFLVLAQMPEPQPGWCQQYNDAMVPIGARKFEPPAITGWESQDAMETLLRIAGVTGDPAYRRPIPRALDYFRSCLLPDGRVARYYEFGSNRPLYMDAQYRLTYDDAAAPPHYGWKQDARFGQIERAYREAEAGIPPGRARPTEASVEAVGRIVRDLDSEGRWISVYAGERLVGQPRFPAGFRYLSSEVFRRNVGALCDYLASRPE